MLRFCFWSVKEGGSVFGQTKGKKKSSSDPRPTLCICAILARLVSKRNCRYFQPNDFHRECILESDAPLFMTVFLPEKRTSLKSPTKLLAFRTPRVSPSTCWSFWAPRRSTYTLLWRSANKIASTRAASAPSGSTMYRWLWRRCETWSIAIQVNSWSRGHARLVLPVVENLSVCTTTRDRFFSSGVSSKSWRAGFL